MSQSPLDPTSAVEFDVRSGSVALRGSDRSVLVGVDVLIRFCEAAGAEATKDFARSVGTEAGKRLADALRDGPEGATVESVVDHLGGDLAVLGLGSLSVERWANALLLVVEQSPFGPAGDVFVAGVLEGAMARGLAREATLVPLSHTDGTVRLLVTNPVTAAKVRGWLGQGQSVGQILEQLNSGG